MCNNWPDYPISVWQALGGLIGNTVLICGGSSYVDECYSLTSEKATLVTHMSVGRRYAASIVINDKTLWVTGGNNGGSHASTEYVTLTGTMLGPDLPMTLYTHAMVAINRTCSMVIGGRDENYYYSASTFFYDRNEEEWINGPSLMQARAYHAAGIVTDDVTGEHFVAVTGGYQYPGLRFLNSTEILQDGEWVQGKINITICHLLQFFWFHKTILCNCLNTLALL
jgi:N-acetylneuraminic acid mutarotase